MNKPWRPLPSKRLSVEQAKTLERFSYAAAFVTSIKVGGTIPCLLLMSHGPRIWLQRTWGS